ncbi:MAG: tetratricopeptide repeat protein, partial [Chloroflexota bacterium]
ILKEELRRYQAAGDRANEGRIYKEIGSLYYLQQNYEEALRAQQQALETYYGNILSEIVLDDLDFGGVGRMLALTPNHEVNSLASLHFRNVFDKEEVYQLPASNDEAIAELLSGRELFDHHVTYNYLSTLFREGGKVSQLPVDDTDGVSRAIENGFTPLFVVTPQRQLKVWTAEETPEFNAGDTVVGVTQG